VQEVMHSWLAHEDDEEVLQKMDEMITKIHDDNMANVMSAMKSSVIVPMNKRPPLSPPPTVMQRARALSMALHRQRSLF